MVDIIVYPAVALCYFYQVLRASEGGRLVLDSRASLNVFCLFAIAQPICLAIGGYPGMLSYCITALLSYLLLPRVEQGTGKRKVTGKAASQEGKIKKA